MNKAELIDKLAKDAGVTKTQANDALDSFTKAVADTLKKGGKVTLVGFGTFSVSKRAARNGRNPQTGQIIKIKAKKVA
ncbi:MAG: HU family DNA-binding protein, partial [Chitinophaga sp.]